MSSRELNPSKSYELEASLPSWCVLQWQHLLLCAVFVSIYLLLSYLPVSLPQTWHELVVGSGRYESTELLPLSHGVRYFSIGSLSVTMIAKLHSWGGIESLSVSFALIQTCTLILWAIVFYKVTRRWWFGFLALVLLWTAFFEAPGAIRVALGQGLLATLMLLLIHDGRDAFRMQWSQAGTWRWLGVLMLFAVWVNVHPSFVLGLLFVLGLAIGRMAECVHWSKPMAFVNDDEFRSRVWLFEGVLVATLVNPAGVQLWQAALWWPDNPILQSLGDWNPVVLASWTGGLIASTWAIWFAAARTQRQLSKTALTFAVLATAITANFSDFLVWWSPFMLLLFAVTVGPQKKSSEIAVGKRIEEPAKSNQPFRFVFSLLSLLLIWLGFCLSPVGSAALGGPARTNQQLIGTKLPVHTKAFLVDQLPQEMIWCPHDWADWLQHGTGIATFMNSDRDAVPSRVQDDYLSIFHGSGQWVRLSEQYALTTFVIDKSRQHRVIRHVRRHADKWHVAHEDAMAMVIIRRGN